jgi:hypothetical protein
MDAGVSMQRASTKLLLQFRGKIGLGHLQFLRFPEQLGYPGEVFESFLATRPFAKAPEIGQQLVGNTTTLV